MVTLLDWPTGTVWNHNLVSLWANLMQYRLANEVVSPSQSGWPMGYLFVVPYNTSWPTNHCPHPNQLGQWGTYLWSHVTLVGQQIIVPISIRLANGVPICGPIQHRLANQSLSPSQSGWPMGYLFVVSCNSRLVGYYIGCQNKYLIGQRRPWTKYAKGASVYFIGGGCGDARDHLRGFERQCSFKFPCEACR